VNRWVRRALLVLLVPVAAFVMVNIHEIGHTFLARLFGDTGATYFLYRYSEDGFCLGCNVYDEGRLSYLGNVLVTLGGVLFTTVAMILSLLLRKMRPVGRWVRRTAAIFATVCFLDVPLQVWQGIQADVASQTGLVRVDLADFTYLVATGTGLGILPVKVGLLVALIVDAALFVVLYRGRLGRPTFPSDAGMKAAD
jgi:hypothetical protein